MPIIIILKHIKIIFQSNITLILPIAFPRKDQPTNSRSKTLISPKKTKPALIK
jgi:hypothetical protein